MWYDLIVLNSVQFTWKGLRKQFEVSKSRGGGIG